MTAMADGMDRLPRGRHGLTREQVTGSQRGRMLSAMAVAVAARGYLATSVADVLRGAGVSRETFYQQFSSKQDCFIQALDGAADILIGVMDHAPENGEPAAVAPLERWEQLLAAYLESLASQPALARVFLMEVYAAGPEAVQRRIAVQQQFVEIAVGVLAAASEADRFACEVLVSAISTMVTVRLAVGDVDGLRALRAPLVELTARVLGPGRGPASG